MSQSSVATAPPRRRRGQRAGLERAVIVAAARSLEPGALTLQAVADLLGVDRKALSNHVADRDHLLGLVAEEVFSGYFEMVATAGAIDWREACRAYARGLAASVVETGALAPRTRFEAPRPGFLAPSEAVLAMLLGAGFDDEAAARSLSMLTTLATGYARDVLIAVRDREAPLAARLRRSFAEEGGDRLETLRRITESGLRTSDPEQLERMIDIFLAGVQSLAGQAADRSGGAR